MVALLSTSGTIGFQGIVSSPNPLNAEPGSLELATNCCILTKDNLEPRRGQPPMAATFGADGQVSLQLAEWRAKQRLLVSYANSISGTTGGGLAILSADGTSWSSALDTPLPPDPNNQRMKFAEMANNIYYTASTGLRFLDAVAATGKLAGVSRPCDFNGTIAGTFLSGNPNAAGAWFDDDNAVGYRACIVKKDANNNVKLSAPTGRCVVINPKSISNAIGAVVRATNVVTATVAEGHGFLPGDIFVLGPSPTGDANFVAGNYTVSTVTATTIVWSSVGANAASTVVLTITSGFKSNLIRIYIGNAGSATATGIAAGDFIRLYRTVDSSGATIDPGDEEFLCYERQLNATDMSNKYVEIADTTPESFLGEPLYTNANTGQGLTQSNDKPPKMNDCCVFDGRLFGAQTTDRQRLTLRLLGVGSPNGLQTNDLIGIGNSVFAATAFSQWLPSQNILATAFFNADFYGRKSSAVLDNGRTGRVVSDGDSPAGQMIFEDIDAGGATFYAATSRPSAFQDPLPGITALTEASCSRTSFVTTITTATAHGYTTGDTVVIAYDPLSNDNANFPAGVKTPITVTGATTFTYAEAGADATMAACTAYTYAAKYASDNYAKQLRFTKQGQPEAWPQINWIGGLPDGAEVSRIATLRNSLYVFFKHGPIYTVSGSYPYNVQEFDNTAQLVAADTLVRHSNRLFALTTQGVCAISENGVQVMSLDIDSSLRALIATAQQASTGAYVTNMAGCFGVSYESDRQYQLWMPPRVVDGQEIGTCYVFQSDTNQWTSWEGLRSCGLVFSQNNLLYLGDYEREAHGYSHTNIVRQELKSYQRFDYDDLGIRNIVGTTTDVAGVSRFTPATPADIDNVLTGDYYYGVGSGETSYVLENFGTYITLATNVTPQVGVTIDIIRPINSTFQWLIDPGGSPAVLKHWREVQLHFAYLLIHAAIVATFSNERTTTTKSVTLEPELSLLSTTTQTPIEVAVAVPSVLQRAAMVQASININLPWASWQLLGWSKTHEAISEKTGRVA